MKNGYKWISPTGEVVTTKTTREFADRYGFRASNARSLACGHFKRLNGWCSGHRSAGKTRARFLTQLVNTSQQKSDIVGASVTGFASRHGLCANEVYKLLTGKSICYRGWTLAKTRELIAQVPITDAAK